MEHIYQITDFIVKSFLHIWPYLLISVPLAAFVNLSGASAYITRALSKKPLVAILLATIIGAFSPFCSCGVIPVIASLLIGGVPLAPVMSFWIASPSMDPEIFFLSVATIGWKLSVWRLASTFFISLSGGLITHFLWNRGFLRTGILRQQKLSSQTALKPVLVAVKQYNFIHTSGLKMAAKTEQPCGCSEAVTPTFIKILNECMKAFIMVSKFMLLAFFLNALIKFYLPEDLITRYMATDSPISVLIATFVGIPFYTSNASALPIVSGLLTLGMNQGAALAFLIAGPVTTLPAMAAVWGIVKPKVFFLFLTFGLTGSIIAGYLFNLLN
ncbi:MAG TPA: permease [Bacteroidales bacterium]|nr:permease [Bacteroidales bacterium]